MSGTEPARTKTWTGLHHSDSVNRAWRFVGGELVAPTWRDVRGSLTPENCEAMCELIRQHAGTRDRLDILELGTQYGRTAIAMCALLGQHDVEVRVDTCDTFAPSADFPHNHASPADVQRNVEKLGLTAQIRSHHVSSSENLMKRFAGRSFDVVFVDACHEFRQVVADCVVARSLVRPGGLIVGDDWHLEDVRDGCRAVFGASEPRALGQNMWYRQGDAEERAGLADDP
jgi:predicted O-methyltransferase YrrM